jgi:hypothetical protein
MKSTWPNINNFGTSINFLASTLNKRLRVFSETPEPSSFASSAGEKNSLWCLWGYPSDLLRPKDPPSAGSVLRGYAGLPGRGDSPRLLSQVPEGEAGKAGVAGRFSLLQQTICFLHRPSLSGFQYPGCSPRVPSGLEDGQGPGEAIHAGAVAAGGDPRAESHRDR